MRARRGAAAIEYALVLPVLLLLVLGLVDWSWYMTCWLDVHVATGRGVRIASGSETDPEGAARAAICASLDAQGLDCGELTLTPRRVADPAGPALELEVSLPFHAPVGLVRTPRVLRVTATTAWYGWVYAEE